MSPLLPAARLPWRLYKQADAQEEDVHSLLQAQSFNDANAVIPPVTQSFNAVEKWGQKYKQAEAQEEEVHLLLQILSSGNAVVPPSNNLLTMSCSSSCNRSY